MMVVMAVMAADLHLSATLSDLSRFVNQRRPSLPGHVGGLGLVQHVNHAAIKARPLF